MQSSLLRVCYANSSRFRSSSYPSASADIDGGALFKQDIITALKIDPGLWGEESDEKGPIHAYAKCKAIKAVYTKLQGMSWTGTKPNYGAIISLFLSTSFFYSHYKHFNEAIKHPKMVECWKGGRMAPLTWIFGKRKGITILFFILTNGLQLFSDLYGMQKNKKMSHNRTPKLPVNTDMGATRSSSLSLYVSCHDLSFISFSLPTMLSQSPMPNTFHKVLVVQAILSF